MPKRLSYIAFDLLIARTATGYRAQVINSPAGQAKCTFTLPFQLLDVENFRLRLGSTRTVRRIDSPEVAAANTFGQRLFTVIFADYVRDCLPSSLVQHGTLAVIAMQFELTDEAAMTFAQQFCSALVDNYPVNTALATARKGIYSQGNGLKWDPPRCSSARLMGIVHYRPDLPTALKDQVWRPRAVPRMMGSAA